MKETPYRGWEYSKLGDYHRNLDPNWSYAPTYYSKEKHLDTFVNSLPTHAIIRDLGCGEGVFVEKYHNLGRAIRGLDLNYSSEFVDRGSVLDLPYETSSVHAIILMDVFEHLTFEDQPRALKEIHRVLNDEGILYITVPNLAHLNSRWNMVWKGELDRTDSELNHVGERPYRENAWLLQRHGFEIKTKFGMTLTLPWVYRSLICSNAKKLRWLHDLFEPLAYRLPQIAMLNAFVCSKTR